VILGRVRVRVLSTVLSDSRDYSLIYQMIMDIEVGKSSESVQLAMLKACDACADMGQL